MGLHRQGRRGHHAALDGHHDAVDHDPFNGHRFDDDAGHHDAFDDRPGRDDNHDDSDHRVHFGHAHGHPDVVGPPGSHRLDRLRHADVHPHGWHHEGSAP